MNDAVPKILIVVPVYGAYDYAAIALRTALEHTRVLRPTVCILDDYSPDSPERGNLEASAVLKQEMVSRENRQCWRAYFSENHGLTAMWNYGLQQAKAEKHDYCCVTNSDVLFAPGWDVEIVAALEKYALVGPVTNAPGTEKEQFVGKYSVTYTRTDTPDAVAAVQSELHSVQKGRFKEHTLNGFCMVAKTETWWKHAFDAERVFCPHNRFNSKHELNPTPLMTLQEYELQRRWHAAGLKSAIALGSYVLHYRSVSRGDAFNKGDWLRKVQG